MKKKSLPPPIVVDGSGTVSSPAGSVTAAKQAEWRATAKRFKDDPRTKVQFAVNFADLVLIRLDEIARSTTSSKVLLDCASKGERYVAFAFKEVKE